MSRLAAALRRPSRFPARPRVALAVLSAAGALVLFADGSAHSTGTPGALEGTVPAGTSAAALARRVAKPSKAPLAPAPGELVAPTPSSPALIAAGSRLYSEGCSSCHGLALQGRHGVAPSLIGVGAGPADFYLTTGRMPLENPRQQPLRAPPRYKPGQIRALVAFIAAHGGPPPPDADPARGDLALGLHAFTLNCAGCHQIVARGGLTIGAIVPDLHSATARQVAEAVRMGPYLMPHFPSSQIDQHELDSIARYVLWTRHPDNAGGWGIYNIGPIPEGAVAWFLLLLSLVLFARLIGERTT